MKIDKSEYMYQNEWEWYNGKQSGRIRSYRAERIVRVRQIGNSRWYKRVARMCVDTTAVDICACFACRSRAAEKCFRERLVRR